MRLNQRLRRELGTISRFGLVGVAATLVHIGMVRLLLDGAQMPIMAANALAFLTAFWVSFLGHYHVTFGAPGGKRRAFRRFVATGCLNFAVNNVALALLLETGWLSPFVSAVAAIAAIPLMTFLVARFWAFAHPGE